jgi:hypothetical protein
MVEIGNFGSHRRIQVEVDDRARNPNLIFSLTTVCYHIIQWTHTNIMWNRVTKAAAIGYRYDLPAGLPAEASSRTDAML